MTLSATTTPTSFEYQLAGAEGVVAAPRPMAREALRDTARAGWSFANLAGVAPIPASSGLTTRYRLNRCGDRQLNRALHVIAMRRMRHDPATRAYLERRRTDPRNPRPTARSAAASSATSPASSTDNSNNHLTTYRSVGRSSYHLRNRRAQPRRHTATRNPFLTSVCDRTHPSFLSGAS